MLKEALVPAAAALIGCANHATFPQAEEPFYANSEVVFDQEGGKGVIKNNEIFRRTPDDRTPNGIHIACLNEDIAIVTISQEAANRCSSVVTRCQDMAATNFNITQYTSCLHYNNSIGPIDLFTADHKRFCINSLSIGRNKIISTDIEAFRICSTDAARCVNKEGREGALYLIDCKSAADIVPQIIEIISLP